MSSLLLAANLNIIGAAVFQARATAAWLQVERLAGTVSIHTSGQRSARVGDRLSAVGQGMSTGSGSSANLSLDNGIGSVAVAQNTRMTIQRLSTLADGARVTILDVSRGQARLQVRSFSNPNSRLELHTPSGVAAVRGTEFGVAVAEDGKTSIATLEGQVEAISQGVDVPVDAGLASIIRPGEPPTPPLPLDRELEIQWRLQMRRGNQLIMAGQIDAANTLLFGEDEIAISRTGNFELDLPLSNRHRTLMLTVRNPMGESRIHRLHTWQLDDLDR
ncbi:MAG: FecR family protein [Cyanobacteria bacterium P01_F01_bin.56]